MRRYTTPEEDDATFAHMEAWRSEVKRTTDVTLFSPRMQQIIKDYEEKQEADRLARETNLEYLRRTNPHMTEGERMSYMFLSIITGKSIREGQL